MGYVYLYYPKSNGTKDQMTRKAILLVPILFLASCYQEEIIKSEYPVSEPKLVVYSFLSPESDSIFVHVTKSNNRFGDSYTISDTYVVDASVIISNEDGDTVRLVLKNDQYPIYVASQDQMQVMPDKYYYLSVSAKGFATVTAETWVPQNALVWQVVKVNDILYPEDNYVVDGIEIFAKWIQPDSNNFGSKILTNITTEYFDSSEPYLVVFSLADDSYSISSIGANYTYYNQLPTVGYTSVETNCSTPLGTFKVDSGKIYSKLNPLYLFLITTDKHLTMFNKSMLTFSEIWYKHDSFLEQYRGIVPEYTNIEGGLGVFGSYLTNKYTINLSNEKN